MIYRRQRNHYIFGIFLAVVAVLNLLFYFILTRPSQTEYARLQADIQQLQKQVSSGQLYLKNLEQTAGKLENFDKDKNALLMMHLVNRNEGYSRIQGKLNGILQKSGVRYSRIQYSLNPEPQAGLNAVSIVVPVEGNYTNVVNFIRELENSETFFLINAISVEQTTLQEPGRPAAFTNTAAAGGAVSLSLTLETFFYQ
jgi:Tfp pilus assembly protein PilO